MSEESRQKKQSKCARTVRIKTDDDEEPQLARARLVTDDQEAPQTPKSARTVRIRTDDGDEPQLARIRIKTDDQEAPQTPKSVRTVRIKTADGEEPQLARVRIKTDDQETPQTPGSSITPPGVRSTRFDTGDASLSESFINEDLPPIKDKSEKKSFFARLATQTRSFTRGATAPFWRFDVDSGSDTIELDATIDTPDYFFTRSSSARRSLAITLGVHRKSMKASQNADSHHIDVYWKANTTTCTRNLLAVTVGRGILDLPAAMALCGIVPGFVILSSLGILNLFFMHRTVEAPQVLRKSMSFFEDIADAIFSPMTFRILVFVDVLALFGQMVKVFETELTSFGNQLRYMNIGSFAIERVGKFEMMGLVPLVTVIIAPFALRTSAKALHMNSTIAVYMQRVIVVCLCIYSMVHIYEDWGEHRYVIINYDIFNQLRGFSMLLHAFFGPMLVPSILSDMLHPGEAKHVCNLVMRETMIVYFSVATLGYFGCASVAANLPNYDFFKVLAATEGNTRTLILRILFTIKNITTFPLFFNPWRRLIESFLHLEADPAISLNLPWAVRRLQRHKRILRIGLLLLIPLVYMAMRFASQPQAVFQIFYALALFFPILFSKHLFPAWFTAILWSKSFDDEYGESPFFYSLSFALENDSKSGRSIPSRPPSPHSRYSRRSTYASRSRHFTSMSSSHKSVAGSHKSFAANMRKRVTHLIDIDLPPSMAEDRANNSWIRRAHDEFEKRCSCIFELNEEISLLSPAWSKTLSGNCIIFVCCCIAVGFWAASVVDVVDEIFFTDPEHRKVFSG